MQDLTFPVLRVDLTQKRLREEAVDLSLIFKFLGGRGLGAKILFEELPPSTDPFSAENKLLFVAGPRIGTGAPWCVKYTVMTKSPLSETILMSLAGGFFGPALRRSGYDVLIIEGRSEAPIYLSIQDGKAECREASLQWGMTTE